MCYLDARKTGGSQMRTVPATGAPGLTGGPDNLMKSIITKCLRCSDRRPTSSQNNFSGSHLSDQRGTSGP